MKRLLIAAALLVLACGVVFAQDSGDPVPNDPAASDDANACYVGGTMEGKCALDADGDGVLEDFEEDWAWECGWYLIRLESGLITVDQTPTWCETVVGSVGRCFNNGVSSFKYVGPPNAIGNAVFYMSLDCSGEGIRPDNSPLIFANSVAEAAALCEALGPIIFLDQLITLGWNTPDNYWGCSLATGGPVRSAGGW